MEPGSEKQKNDAIPSTLGIALSGGGHRASLFGLGALLYLAVSGTNDRVAAISSVSGGSITNAFVASECDFQNLKNKDEFERVASRLSSTIVKKGMMRLTILSIAYFILLMVLGLLMFTVTAWAWPLVIQWHQSVLLIFFWGILWLLRGQVLERLMGTALFRGKTKRFRDLKTNCWHIFCATDLIAGYPFFFVGGPTSWTIDPPSGLHCDSDYSQVYGDGSKIKLRTAVRASSAFFGVLPPRRIKFKSQRGWQRITFLSDGGIWNNLGTQWWDIFEGSSILDPFENRLWRPDNLLVIDASAPPENLLGTYRLTVPWIAEFFATRRAVEVIYANTLEPRREILRQQRYMRSKVRTISLVSLGDTVGVYAESIVKKGGPPISEKRPWYIRAEQWLEYQKKLPSEVDRRSLARESSEVKTTLSRISKSAAVNLLIAGYLQTMEAMHIDFGHPLIDFPGRKYFQKLIKNT